MGKKKGKEFTEYNGVVVYKKKSQRNFPREEGGVVLTRHQAFHFKSGHVLRHFYERHQLFERRQGRTPTKKEKRNNRNDGTVMVLRNQGYKYVLIEIRKPTKRTLMGAWMCPNAPAIIQAHIHKDNSPFTKQQRHSFK
ncbi:hypothetical protein OUZ56_019228 [Daphnia magna]|uniref:Uncharacterized protein n=1 Tax=Daphnia magna TaxID=35525 RepID=A0ABQ9ZB04_9CRUS|nr:hypothetical protein OUZ56_019228 [Daphnia magna]